LRFTETNQSIDGHPHKKMPINKFGLFERRNNDDDSHWSGLVRHYVRNNALCCVATDYDAKSRKIRRVAQPETDTDAVNKLYVEQCLKTVKNQQRKSNEKLIAFEKDVRALQAAVNKLSRATNTNLETAIKLQ